MDIQRIFAIICLVAGAVSIGVSIYIDKEVAAGKQQIASGQQSVEAGKKLFNITPETSPLGDVFTGSAEERIAQGQQEVDYYTKLSKLLNVSGFVLIGLGIVAFFLKKKKSGRK